ncbi:MAG: hypothetical protein QOG20_4486 [Pseudonocardiales bacterium]|jgi:hypothetical protein|nr:hypothetical protein [Pseudonocardiales bacterium]
MAEVAASGHRPAGLSCAGSLADRANQMMPSLTGKSTLAYCRSVGDVYKAIADLGRRTILDELIERDRQTLFELCGRLTMKHGFTLSRQANRSTWTCSRRPGL